MDFFSPVFFGFFVIVLLTYYSVRDKNQRFVIFLSSSIFIALVSISVLFFTYLFIFVNYGLASLIDKYQHDANLKKLFYNLGIILNIGSLIFFKYFNWFLESIFQVFHFFNSSSFAPTLNIILPIGISYYTFQGISYLIQLNRGNERLEKNFIIFSNYFIFFPKFLAGPIEFSKSFIPQLTRSYSYNWPKIFEGLKLILWGAFKKLVIADRLSILIEGIYSNLDLYSGNMLVITFLLEPIHIYCDFSGYTDIALGIGIAFGLKLTNNFNNPFFATSITTFWQRWHISLTKWCNEFIFKKILFRNRRWGIFGSAYAVLLTFVVIGIWHGPRWNFLILGVLQAIAINFEFFTKSIRYKVTRKLPSKFVIVTSIFIVYFFFCVTLVFFYSPKFSDATYIFSNIFVNIDFTKLNLAFLSQFDKILLISSLILLFIVEFRQEQGKDVFNEINNWPDWLRTSVYYVLFIIVIYFGSPIKEFVYMQF